MFKDLKNIVIGALLLGLLAFAVVKMREGSLGFPNDGEAIEVTQTVDDGVIIHQPADLEGVWRSEAKGAKKSYFEAQITKDFISIDLKDVNESVDYYEGALDRSQESTGLIKSTATYGGWSLSVSPFKDFWLKNGTLSFEYGIAGFNETIKMSKV